MISITLSHVISGADVDLAVVLALEHIDNVHSWRRYADLWLVEWICRRRRRFFRCDGEEINLRKKKKERQLCMTGTKLEVGKSYSKREYPR